MQPQNSVASGSLAIQTMEKFLSLLNSHTEPWLNFGSTFLDKDPTYTLLSIVGLLLVYLWYLILKPFFPSLRKRKDIRKLQGSTKKRKERFKGQRTQQRKADDMRKLWSIMQSSLGQLHDPKHFRQLLCPDPFCHICNIETAKVSRLLSRASLEDGIASVSSLASTALVTETSCTLSSSLSANSPEQPVPAPWPECSPPSPSTVSPKQVVPLKDLLSVTPFGNSLPPEPAPPLNPKFPPQLLASLPLPPQHATKKAESVLQPEATLSLEGRSSELSPNIPTTNSNDTAICAPWQSTEDSLSPVSTCGKTLESDADPQDLTVFCPAGSSKAKPEELHVSQQFQDPKNSADQLEQKCTQLFQDWSFYSECLKPTSPASASSLSVCFNTISDYLTHPKPLSSKRQPQTLLQTSRQSQSQCVPPAQAQSQPQLPILDLPSPSFQLRICGVCFHRPKGEKQPLTPSQMHHLEYNILKKEQERVWGLPSIVKKSQGEFCPPAPKLSLVTKSPKAHDPRSILPGDFPLTSELRKKLEHHLRKRLIQHRWGLPRRILASLSLMTPRTELPESSELTCSHYGLTWISFFKRQSSKDLRSFKLSPRGNLQENLPETLCLEEEAVKEQGHSAETGHKDHVWSDSEVAPGNGLQCDSQTDVESQAGSLSCKSSKTSGMKECQEQLENALKVHLSRKFKQINDSEIPSMVRRSWHSIKVALPQIEKSPSQMKDMPGMMGQESQENTDQDVQPLVSRSKGEILEEHIRQFHRSMMCGLPPKVQESIKNYSLRGNPTQSYPHFLFTSSTSLTSGVDSKPGVSKTLTGRSNIKYGDKMGAINSAMVDHSMKTGRVLEGISVPQDPKTYDYKSQAAVELNLKADKHIQDLAPSVDKPLASDEFTFKRLIIPAQGPSSGDMTASPVLPEHLPAGVVCVGQGQEPWIPAHVPGKHLNKNFPPTEKRKCPLAPETGECGGGDTKLGTSQPRGQSHSAQDRTSEGTCGSKSSTPLSMKGQSPPLNRARNQVKHFLQWLCPGRIHKASQRSLEKSSTSSSPVQGSGLHKGRAVFPGNTSAHRATRQTDKILREELGGRHGARDITSPQVPLFSLMKSGKTQRKAEPQVQVEPGQSHHLHCQASSSKVPTAPANSQTAAFASQKRWVGHRNRKPQKDVTVQEKISFQRQPWPLPHREQASGKTHR